MKELKWIKLMGRENEVDEDSYEPVQKRTFRPGMLFLPLPFHPESELEEKLRKIMQAGGRSCIHELALSPSECYNNEWVLEIEPPVLEAFVNSGLKKGDSYPKGELQAFSLKDECSTSLLNAYLEALKRIHEGTIGLVELPDSVPDAALEVLDREIESLMKEREDPVLTVKRI